MTSFTFFLFFIPFLAIVLLAINFIFAPYNPNAEKRTAFECGFHSFLGQNRSQFSISFFIFALLFLLFDLEILLIYPYAMSSHSNGIYGLIVMLIFFLLLTVGFAFELGKKALVIYSKQNKKVIKEVSVVRRNVNIHRLQSRSIYGNLSSKRTVNISGKREFSTTTSLSTGKRKRDDEDPELESSFKKTKIDGSDSEGSLMEEDTSDKDMASQVSLKKDETIGEENNPSDNNVESEEDNFSTKNANSEENNPLNSPKDVEDDGYSDRDASDDGIPEGEVYDEYLRAMREMFEAQKEARDNPLLGESSNANNPSNEDVLPEESPQVNDPSNEDAYNPYEDGEDAYNPYEDAEDNNPLAEDNGNSDEGAEEDYSDERSEGSNFVDEYRESINLTRDKLEDAASKIAAETDRRANDTGEGVDPDPNVALTALEDYLQTLTDGELPILLQLVNERQASLDEVENSLETTGEEDIERNLIAIDRFIDPLMDGAEPPQYQRPIGDNTGANSDSPANESDVPSLSSNNDSESQGNESPPEIGSDHGSDNGRNDGPEIGEDVGGINPMDIPDIFDFFNF
jgi:NADH-ubiquinone oxidoreductase chain 3